MNTTGIFTVHRVKIPLSSVREPITLFPFGDVHRSSSMCNVESWKRFLDEARNEKGKVIFLGMGDYDDMASGSERPIIFDERLHESTSDSIEKMLLANVNLLCKEMSFMKGRILGLMDGNHYGVFSDGTTTTQRMCQILKCKYLGSSSFIRIQIRRGVCKLNCDIWAHHGKGASRLAGSSFNTVQQMAEAAEADLFIMGHDHRRGAIPMTKLCLRHKRNGDIFLYPRKQLYVRSGSFLKGYVENTASYVADKGMNPVDLGAVKIQILADRIREKINGRYPNGVAKYDRMMQLDLKAII